MWLRSMDQQLLFPHYHNKLPLVKWWGSGIEDHFQISHGTVLETKGHDWLGDVI